MAPINDGGAARLRAMEQEWRTNIARGGSRRHRPSGSKPTLSDLNRAYRDLQEAWLTAADELSALLALDETPPQHRKGGHCQFDRCGICTCGSAETPAPMASLECPCCGDTGAVADSAGLFSDGQKLICGCPGWVSVDSESEPFINNGDDPCSAKHATVRLCAACGKEAKDFWGGFDVIADGRRIREIEAEIKDNHPWPWQTWRDMCAELIQMPTVAVLSGMAERILAELSDPPIALTAHPDASPFWTLSERTANELRHWAASLAPGPTTDQEPT